MTIGEKLAKLRKEQNLTQEQFAEMMNVSRQSVSKWELGTAYPETEKLIRISKTWGCSLDYLLKDEIEQAEIGTSPAEEDARINRLRAGILTYLSFPPLFGWIVAVFSLKLQEEHIHNKKQIFLSIAGMIFSITLTALMIIGAAAGL